MWAASGTSVAIQFRPTVPEHLRTVWNTSRIAPNEREVGRPAFAGQWREHSDSRREPLASTDNHPRTQAARALEVQGKPTPGVGSNGPRHDSNPGEPQSSKLPIRICAGPKWLCGHLPPEFSSAPRCLSPQVSATRHDKQHCALNKHHYEFR
jgi:hypothetical protein